MNLLSLPEPAHSEDEIDTLLRGFFQAEMPDPWPTFQAPATTLPLPARRQPSRWAGARSRLALAASVALLLSGPLLISGRLGETPLGEAGITPVDGAAMRETLPMPVPSPSTPHVDPDKLQIDEFFEVGPDGTLVPRVTIQLPE